MGRAARTETGRRASGRAAFTDGVRTQRAELGTACPKGNAVAKAKKPAAEQATGREMPGRRVGQQDAGAWCTRQRPVAASDRFQSSARSGGHAMEAWSGSIDVEEYLAPDGTAGTPPNASGARQQRRPVARDSHGNASARDGL